MSHSEIDFRRILDMVQGIAICLLILHFYYFCYAAFSSWGLVSIITDRLMTIIVKMGLFSNFNTTKLLSLGLLTLGLLGTRGRPTETIKASHALWCTIVGLAIYFGSEYIFRLGYDARTLAIAYMTVTVVGFIVLLTGVALLSRIILVRLGKDVFNTLNETFPQQEQRVGDDSYVNIPTVYKLQGRRRRGWINIPSFRGLLILGQPGSGKSWYIIRNVIEQHISRGFAMVVLDYKYDELTRLTYNCFLRYKSRYSVLPAFYTLYFEDPRYSHRCNPLHSSTLEKISDASESARSALLGLNKSWIGKEGDYWAESAISFMTALIWYLRKYQGGKYCTYPHVIELAQVEYSRLFSILRAEPDILNYISPFVAAYVEGNKETLDNQVSTFRIAISRISSPEVYYVMSGDDFSLHINDPDAPKILCFGNTPQRSGVYGSIISLYLVTINRMVNRRGGTKSSYIYEEMNRYYVHKLDEILAVGRSNKVAVVMCAQNIEQIRFNYGKDQADVIVTLPASLISGQVSGDSARFVSDMVGRNVQQQQSLQVNQTDTSFSKSTNVDMAVPPAKVSQLSSGEFVGVVGDTPDNPIAHKAFHGHIDQDNRALAREQEKFVNLPVVSEVSQAEVVSTYQRIKEEIASLVDAELTRMQNTPELAHLVII